MWGPAVGMTPNENLDTSACRKLRRFQTTSTQYSSLDDAVILEVHNSPLAFVGFAVDKIVGGHPSLVDASDG